MIYRDDETFINESIRAADEYLAGEKAAQVERSGEPVPMMGAYEIGSLEEELAWEAMLDMIEEERDRSEEN